MNFKKIAPKNYATKRMAILFLILLTKSSYAQTTYFQISCKITEFPSWQKFNSNEHVKNFLDKAIDAGILSYIKPPSETWATTPKNELKSPDDERLFKIDENTIEKLVARFTEFGKPLSASQENTARDFPIVHTLTINKISNKLYYSKYYTPALEPIEGITIPQFSAWEGACRIRSQQPPINKQNSRENF